MRFNCWQNIEEGQTYHIYNKAISEIKLFRDKDDYLYFLSKYEKYFQQYLNTYAYCLIPNHFHLLIKMKSREEIEVALERENTKSAIKYLNGEIPVSDFISNQFKRMFSSYSIKYNNKYSREGSLFVKKMKKVKVSTDGSIQRLLCYIHHNPIHHGLTQEYIEWKYSSYYEYLHDGNKIVAKEEMLEWLGGKNVFLELHKSFKFDNWNTKKDKNIYG